MSWMHKHKKDAAAKAEARARNTNIFCVYPGCGLQLTYIENFYGDRCFRHSNTIEARKGIVNKSLNVKPKDETKAKS